MRCKAKTKEGRLCRNKAGEGMAYCSVHKDELDMGEIVSTTLGAVLGNIVAPGFGWGIGGAVIGNFANRLNRPGFRGGCLV